MGLIQGFSLSIEPFSFKNLFGFSLNIDKFFHKSTFISFFDVYLMLF
jgi:hypothetical protein